MLNYAYANYGGYFWMIAIAFITYLIMTAVKKMFGVPTKAWVKNEKDRKFINLAFGIALSAGIGFTLGKFGNMLFATDVYFMWFIAGGLLANYANLVIRKYTDADASAFAKAFINAMNESNMDVSEADLPVLTNEIGAIVKAYADNNANSRKSKLHNVASGITGSIEITDDEQKELEKAIAQLKSKGFDTATLDSLYAKYKADGKVTVAEADSLKEVIRAIHKVTNI